MLKQFIQKALVVKRILTRRKSYQAVAVFQNHHTHTK